MKYWTINGIRFEPDDASLTGFVLKNVTEDMRVTAKINKSAIKNDDINTDVMCEVTCVGCTFTYHAGGISSETSGSVPQGATIIVFSDSAEGFSIDGETPQYVGSSFFRLKVEEDVEISVPGASFSKAAPDEEEEAAGSEENTEIPLENAESSEE